MPRSSPTAFQHTGVNCTGRHDAVGHGTRTAFRWSHHQKQSFRWVTAPLSRHPLETAPLPTIPYSTSTRRSGVFNFDELREDIEGDEEPALTPEERRIWISINAGPVGALLRAVRAVPDPGVQPPRRSDAHAGYNVPGRIRQPSRAALALRGWRSADVPCGSCEPL